MKTHVLIIEDDESIQTLLFHHLSHADFSVHQAYDGESGLSYAFRHRPDVILLDWMLPHISGYDVLSQIRQHRVIWSMPVIMLTARSTASDQVQGLDGGADDYVTKPFSPDELLARMRALLRRVSGDYGGSSRYLLGGDITLDLVQKRVHRAGILIHLGPKEFYLLAHFLRHPGRVYSRQQLLDHIWGASIYVELRTVDVHIRRLRKALNIKGGKDFIRTVHAMGYAFDPPPHPDPSPHSE